MRPQRIKAKKVLKKKLAVRSPAELADKIGEKHTLAKNKQIESESELNACKEETEALLEDAGLKDEKKAYITGERYRVGVYTRGGTPSFDQSLFKELYPKTYAKYQKTVTVTTLDEAGLEAAAKKNPKIMEAVKACIKLSKPSRVIDIKPL